MFSVVFALGIVNASFVLAKEKVAAQQQNAQQQPSEKEKKEQQIKTIKEALKKNSSLNEQMQQKVKQIFKNFKKENFEVENYNLEVFKKGEAFILVYKHKKTGAQVFFSLVLNKEALKQRIDELIFKAPTKDDKGLIHFLEHCIANPFIEYYNKKLQANAQDLNALTTTKCLSFVSRVGMFGLNEKLEKEYVKKLTKELINPAVFEKDSEIFEVEKKRILNEIKDKKGVSCENNEEEFMESNREFKAVGEIFEVEKAKFKDLKKFYEKYIHPSNCLLIKSVAELNPKTIKNYLNMWHENYFKHFEKKEIKNNNYELKNKDRYLPINLSKDSYFFTSYDEEKNKEQKLNFKAFLTYSLDELNFKQEQFFLINLLRFKDEITNFGKTLGYEKTIVSPMNVFFCRKQKRTI